MWHDLINYFFIRFISFFINIKINIYINNKQTQYNKEMFNSISGADDSAPVLYYSNTNYNHDTSPKLSNVTEHLTMSLMNNQSNYLVAINKLKITDLSGVILGYFPQNTLKLGMTLSDGVSSVYKDNFLTKPNTDQYVSNYDLFTTTINKNIVSISNITSSSFVQSVILPRVPVFCNFISLNNSLVYNDYQNIYTFNLTTLIETLYATIGTGSITCSDNYNYNIIVCLDNGTINRFDLSATNTPIVITTALQVAPYRISTVSINSDTISVTWIDNADFLLLGTNSILKLTNFTYSGLIINSTQILATNTQCRKSLYSSIDKLLLTALDGSPRSGAWYIPPIVQSTDEIIGDPITLNNLLPTITNAPATACDSYISSYVYIPSRNQAIGIDSYGNRTGYINNLTPDQIYTINFDTMTWLPSDYLLPATLLSSVVSYPRYLANGIINEQPFNLVAMPFSSTQIVVYIQILTPNSVADPWLLYANLNINASQQPVNVNTNLSFPTSDSFFYITIDGDNNIFLTFTQQATTPPMDARYFTVKLNAMTIQNDNIVIDPTPYEPVVVPLMLNTVNLSTASGHPDDYTYNLMYDANTMQFYARNNNNLLYGYYDNILNSFFFKIGANMANISANIWSQTLRYKQCVNGMNFQNSSLPATTPYITAYITTPSIQPTALVSYYQKYLFNALHISHNNIENFYTINNNPNTSQTNYKYQGAGVFSTISITDDIVPYYNMSTQYNTVTSVLPHTAAQNAIYSLQEYINSINVCFVNLYNSIKINGFTPLITTPPNVSLDYQTGFLTLNYDPQFTNINNGLFVNDALLQYMFFQVSPNNVSNQLTNKYILNSATGHQEQTKFSIFKLNTVDKIIVISNMSIIGDQIGDAGQQTLTFTDLDLNTNDPNFLNMSGCFIYASDLLRNYTLQSNQQMRAINYQINVRYKDKTELPYYIPVGENVSIKFQFTRIY